MSVPINSFRVNLILACQKGAKTSLHRLNEPHLTSQHRLLFIQIQNTTSEHAPSQVERRSLIWHANHQWKIKIIGEGNNQLPTTQSPMEVKVNSPKQRWKSTHSLAVLGKKNCPVIPDRQIHRWEEPPSPRTSLLPLTRIAIHATQNTQE